MGRVECYKNGFAFSCATRTLVAKSAQENPPSCLESIQFAHSRCDFHQISSHHFKTGYRTAAMACTYRQDYTWNATLCWNFQEGVRSQSTVIGTRGFMTFKQDNTSYFGWSMTNSAWDACSAGSDVEHCSFTYSEAVCPRNHTALSIDMRQGTTTHYCCPTYVHISNWYASILNICE